jgi:hypothetical protein
MLPPRRRPATLPPRWTGTRSALCVACLSFLLHGCASLDPAPPWAASPARALANGCPDLTGTYGTRAVEAFPAGTQAPPSLNDLLGPQNLRDLSEAGRRDPALPGATSASFASDGEWLHVRFRHPAAGEATLHFKHKQWWGGFTEGADAMYQCRQLELGPALGFDGPRRTIAAVPWVFHEGDFDFVFLSKAADGSLVVNYRIDRVVLVGTGVGSHARWQGSLWWRYPPVVADR